jgi:hypothetical protein
MNSQNENLTVNVLKFLVLYFNPVLANFQLREMDRFIVLESDRKLLGSATVEWTIKEFAGGISIGQKIFKTPSFEIETPGDPILRVRRFHFVLETSKKSGNEKETKTKWVRTLYQYNSIMVVQ